MAESTTATEVKVEFEMEVWDELPQGAPRKSRLTERIEKVKTLPTGKPILFDKKETAIAATGLANSLKLRYGITPDAYGFKFKTRKLDDGKFGVFVIYTPEAIVPGASDEVDAKYNAHRAKAAENQKARAEKAKAEGNGKAKAKAATK